MDIHNSRVLKAQDQPLYRCSLCSYTTINQPNLANHARRHSDARPFSCPHCDQTYATMGGLRGHILKSGLHPGLCLYHCTWCSGYSTNVRTAMKRHLYEKHPAIMPRNQPCIDINEILGIYHPESDPQPMIAFPSSLNSTVQQDDNDPESRSAGVRHIAPRQTLALTSRKHPLTAKECRNALSTKDTFPLTVSVAADMKYTEALESRTTFRSVTDQSDYEAVESEDDKGIKPRDHLMHAGIGLWTRNSIGKYM